MLWKLFCLQHHESLFMPRSGSSFAGRHLKAPAKPLAIARAKLFLVKK